MWLCTLVCLIAQEPRLELAPSLPRRGEEFIVRATDGTGKAVAGAMLELEDRRRLRVAVAPTATDGAARFIADDAGAYLVRWQVDPDLIVAMPLQVAEPPSRLLLAVWAVPLGLLLGWRALRRDVRREDAAPTIPAGVQAKTFSMR
jgi:hypothetical protein